MSSGLEKPDEVQDAIEEGPTRYAAFAMRLRTLITASSRYIAYSSDIGEAFRPLTHPAFVRGAYGISWAYILGDCGYAGYLAHKERSGMPVIKEKAAEALSLQQKVELRKKQLEESSNVDKAVRLNPLEISEPAHVGLVVARRAVFQSLASMALPAFTIHSIVRYSAPLFARASSQRIKASGPTVAGLAAVPALPFLFDHPVEHVVDTAFDWVEEKVAEGMAKSKKKQEVEAKREPLIDCKGSDPLYTKESISKAVILGIGVDTLFLPRLRALLSRQASRIQAAKPRSSTVARSCPAISVASERMARRILHDSEFAEWRKRFGHEADQEASEQHLRWLAVRWTAKEAAFKAVDGHLGFSPKGAPLNWHDAFVQKSEAIGSSTRPRLQYTDRVADAWRENYQRLHSKMVPERQNIHMPKIHLSITHDGDYVVAFVVAEGQEP